MRQPLGSEGMCASLWVQRECAPASGFRGNVRQPLGWVRECAPASGLGEGMRECAPASGFRGNVRQPLGCVCNWIRRPILNDRSPMIEAQRVVGEGILGARMMDFDGNP